MWASNIDNRMRQQIKRYIGKIRCGGLWAFAAVALSALAAGCQTDFSDPYEEYGYDGIRFKATVGAPEAINTRAEAKTYNVSSKFYDCNFYLWVSGNDIHGNPKAKGSTYVIPSGYEAALIPATGAKTLNWFSREDPHDFWGIALPNQFDLLSPDNGQAAGGKYTPAEDQLEDFIYVDFPGSRISDLLDAQGSKWSYTLDGENTTDTTWCWRNGQDLEQVIGAYSGPHVYNENGIYVPLQFRHLLSKVFLKSLVVVNNYDGTTTSSSSSTNYINNNLRGEITFYGMPSRAKLYPCPVDETTGEARYPYMEAREENGDAWGYDQSHRVTYAITDHPRKYKWEGYEPTSVNYFDCWYICPELDFSMMEFKIEIYEFTGGQWVLSTKYGNQGAYYGDFSAVTFKRDGTSPYQSPDGDDLTILHAGEFLELTIYLYEKGNPSVRGTITASTNNNRDGSSYVHQGLYSIEQVKDFSSIMGGNNEQEKNEYFELNGSGRTTADDPEGAYPDYEEIYGQELRIFELFDDIGSEASGTSTTTKVASPFNVSDGYILDGQGHTVNVASSSMKIGNMRNIYLRYYYNNVERIVYIDNMGNVWLVDPYTFEEKPTNYNVNDVTTNPKTLNLSNGQVS